MIKKNFCLHIKHPVLLECFNETWIFSNDFRKNTQIWNFMKIRPVIAQLFHAYRRTDMTKISRFSQFCESAQKRSFPCRDSKPGSSSS
jgi:hypothetical protein